MPRNQRPDCVSVFGVVDDLVASKVTNKNSAEEKMNYFDDEDGSGYQWSFFAANFMYISLTRAPLREMATAADRGMLRMDLPWFTQGSAAVLRQWGVATKACGDGLGAMPGLVCSLLGFTEVAGGQGKHKLAVLNPNKNSRAADLHHRKALNFVLED